MDNTTQKWFVLLATGHEGPYSLENLAEQLEKRKLSVKSLVWTEGLAEPIILGKALSNEPAPEDLPPPIPQLPPLPFEMEESDIEDESAPPLLVLPTEPIELTSVDEKPPIKLPWIPAAVLLVLAVIAISFAQFKKSQEKFSIRRYPKMSLELHQKIQDAFAFDGWNKDIFFKEFVSGDMTHLWLVTASYQTCRVETQFNSLPGKLLSAEDPKVQFKGEGTLNDHVVELSSFQFTEGHRIIPGLYDVDIKASQCKWDGLVAKVMNGFSDPESEYVTRIKLVLFPKGAEEFNKVLAQLLKKKEVEVKKIEQGADLFWQDVQQKLQTLQALSYQIQQHMEDFLVKDPSGFHKNLKTSVDQYTQKFGHTLTKFVVSNEEDFKKIPQKQLLRYTKKDYEAIVRLTAKNVGLESMKLIEILQSWKKPTKGDLDRMSARVKKTFAEVIEEINGKIIQVSEDRSI